MAHAINRRYLIVVDMVTSPPPGLKRLRRIIWATPHSHVVQMSTSPRLTIVVPVLNEGGALAACLEHLAMTASSSEIIVVDGGSIDNTLAVSASHPLRHRLLIVRGGRHHQLNAACAAAHGDYLLFLPVDARLPHGGYLRLLTWLARTTPVAACLRRHASARGWYHRWLDVWARLRTHWTRGAYMDQGPIFHRAAMIAIGGARPYGSYDTADLGRRLTHSQRFRIATVYLPVSCRDYVRHGTIAVTLAHQRLRVRHHLCRRSVFAPAGRR